MVSMADSPGVHIGARVREIRMATGVSLRELARRLELSPATITALEKGRTTMSVDRLHEIAIALGVSPADLFATGSVSVASRRPDEDESTTGNWREFDDVPMDVVLRAALACIVRKGYHGCSIRDIAEEAESSVSALYHYYPSKQAMLVALFELTMTDLLRRATAARDECDPDDHVERFSRLVESLTLYHSYRKEMGFVGSSEMRSLEDGSYAAIATKRVALQRMVDVEVQSGVDLGLFGTNRPHEAARAVVTMCVSVAQWYNPQGDEQPEEIAAAYVRFALDLVAHRPLGDGG
ncbi:TetR family transcriptional regulator [Rhodococcus sp. BP-252]|uniref:TetR family transcriptional regulator n=1 Tax=unclassified Rhodococcus (in: high G+C Gram-positive bacteria) TaxID=192944 RepID=UPI001C9B93DA|nr:MULTISPECIES: TetR family transcriptional regulator [unclassified Rhodococcus (in: high G+C Gram-positive bacteria)]MBY6414346.1 TetR family transcriptional regulator [Rhodococcus sp. BP-320]MBY6419116.1 TetR family transcriptional regulator [Rhodococcus sp. BP-321]MBY6423793.1 TetR family transcriptional regulator [Rhodococcus sp. BP-324]MBY6429177.1 TetR family transcriptional regulator [Rhodococcus sp. BP-323]MBY6434156.1 TetR family transcriptional regulator [Rhodococcus sp. BP-322]